MDSKGYAWLGVTVSISLALRLALMIIVVTMIIYTNAYDKNKVKI